MSYLLLKGKEASERATSINKLLQKNKIQYTHIVCMGLSGVLMASIVAARYKKHLVILRKDGDTTHGRKREYCSLKPQKNPCIFLDDLIESGDTIKRIANSLAADEWLSDRVAMKAAILYNQGGYSDYRESQVKKVLGVPAFFL